MTIAGMDRNLDQLWISYGANCVFSHNRSTSHRNELADNRYRSITDPLLNHAVSGCSNNGFMESGSADQYIEVRKRYRGNATPIWGLGNGRSTDPTDPTILRTKLGLDHAEAVRGVA